MFLKVLSFFYDPECVSRIKIIFRKTMQWFELWVELTTFIGTSFNLKQQLTNSYLLRFGHFQNFSQNIQTEFVTSRKTGDLV